MERQVVSPQEVGAGGNSFGMFHSPSPTAVVAKIICTVVEPRWSDERLHGLRTEVMPIGHGSFAIPLEQNRPDEADDRRGIRKDPDDVRMPLTVDPEGR